VTDASIRQLACSIDVSNDAVGSSRLPRMLIRWGHGLAQQSAIADLGCCHFSVLGSSLRVDVFEDKDVSADWASGAVVKASAIITEGHCESTLTYTTSSYAFNAALPYSAPVPKYACTVSVIVGSSASPLGEGCPLSSTICFYRATSEPKETFETRNLIHSPKRISQWGGLSGWYQFCQDNFATDRFRLQFGLGI
jgi:hypothetical protein